MFTQKHHSIYTVFLISKKKKRVYTESFNLSKDALNPTNK
jgi:hypothetical protein